MSKHALALLFDGEDCTYRYLEALGRIWQADSGDRARYVPLACTKLRDSPFLQSLAKEQKQPRQ